MKAHSAGQMQAITITAHGGPEVLQAVTVPIPEPRQSEVLIRVAAAGVNRPDALQRVGAYPVPPDADPLPGLEVAGEVVALGDEANKWRPGDTVMALTHGGGYAEYCRVHETHCLAIPDGLTMTEAAAVPETYFTVWYNLVMRAGLKAGETMLIHGGSSGIGTTAIQLAAAIGAVAFATAGSAEKCRFCLDLGAGHAFDYRKDDWEADCIDLTDGNGVDVVLDMVAGPYMQKNINVLRRDGRYAIIAFLQGSTASLDMRKIVTKRLSISGSTLRPQSTREKAAIAMQLNSEVLPMLASRQVRPIIDATFPLADASAAHELMESGRHMGKIVLQT